MDTLVQVNWSEYPTIGAAGLFFIVIGLGFVFVWVFPRYYGLWMAVSFGMAALAAYIGYQIFDHLGPIRPVDITVYAGALVLEVIGVILVSRMYQDERTQDAMILVVVALHFVPMVLILGPLVGLLALCCFGNALIALRKPEIPILPFGLIDSGLKVLFGGMMVWIYAIQ